MGVSVNLICSLVVVTMINTVVDGSKILAVSNIPSVSHSMWYNKLVKLLAGEGHEIIFLDVEKKKMDHANVTHVYLEGAHETFQGFLASMESGEIAMESVVEHTSVFGNIDFITSPQVLGCRNMLLSQSFKQFLKDYKVHKFDLIIFDVGCEAFYGLVPYLGNVPFMVATPYSDPLPLLDYAMNVYDNPSYVPSPFTNYVPEMNFKERILNTFYKLYFYYKLHFHLFPDQQVLAEEVFGRDIGNLYNNILPNMAVMMYVHNVALFGAKPLPPNVVSMAGFHIEPPKPLPQDIKKFMDGAKDGVVYFSLGSNINSTVMSKEKIQIFLDVFNELPQRVVWKLELDDKSNIPPNVLISKWMPQNDILGHPSTRCFIAHGGLHGIQEAIHHGVPILGLPILFDQVATIERLQKEGVALHLKYHKLNKQYIKDQLQKILSDVSIQSRMKEKSSVFRDNADTARERFLFWVNYVLRRSPDQLRHLRSASGHLAWYQRSLLDIILVVVSGLIVIFYICFKILRCIMNCIFPNRRKTKRD